MQKDNPFTEHKEIVSRLREPLKIKAIPYTTTKVRGHQIQIEMNINSDDWKTKIICRGCENIATHICFNASLKGDYYCTSHISDCCEQFNNTTEDKK